MILGIPPNTCSICYNHYNNSKLPTILTSCGHTFCNDCLNMLISDNSISCPECKQITSVNSNNINSLPRNRSLIEMIVFHEIKNKSNEKENTNENNISLLKEFDKNIKAFDETYNTIFNDHPYIKDIKEIFIIKEVNDIMDNIIDLINNYRLSLHKKIKSEFEKIDLIKKFDKNLQKYKDKANYFHQRIETSHIKKFKEELIQLNEDNQSIRSQMINNNIEDQPNELNQSSPEINLNLDNYLVLTNEEVEEIKSDIQFIKLFNLTLTNYSKEIYNPCSYFFVNNFQKEQLFSDIQKILPKICDFDRLIYSYNIEEINTHNSKKLFKYLHELSLESNIEQIRYIFSHFKINPNFIFSEVLDNLSNDLLFHNISTSNINNPYVSPFISQQPNFRINNNSINALRNINSGFNLNSNSNQAYCYKDKIFNMSYLIKLFKNKIKQKEFSKYLIEEFSFLPFKIEIDTVFDLKFDKDWEWMLNLSLF